MRPLLDTHSILWYAFGDRRLISSGKLTVAKPVDVFFADQIRLLSLQLLPITLTHVARASTLPFYHRGPFDRMLVAQSLVEGIALVSADPVMDADGITRLW